MSETFLCLKPRGAGSIRQVGHINHIKSIYTYNAGPMLGPTENLANRGDEYYEYTDMCNNMLCRHMY